MIIRPAIVLACLAIAACAVQPPPDTASVPPGAFGQFDNDVPAANQASSAFAVPVRTRTIRSMPPGHRPRWTIWPANSAATPAG